METQPQMSMPHPRTPDITPPHSRNASPVREIPSELPAIAKELPAIARELPTITREPGKPQDIHRAKSPIPPVAKVSPVKPRTHTPIPITQTSPSKPSPQSPAHLPLPTPAQNKFGLNLTEDPKLKEQREILERSMKAVKALLATEMSHVTDSFKLVEGKIDSLKEHTKLVADSVIANNMANDARFAKLEQLLSGAASSVPAITYHPETKEPSDMQVDVVQHHTQDYKKYYEDLFKANTPLALSAQKLAYVIVNAGMNTVTGEVVWAAFKRTNPDDVEELRVGLHLRLLEALIQLKYSVHFTGAKSSKQNKAGDSAALRDNLAVWLGKLGWTIQHSWPEDSAQMFPHLGFRWYAHRKGTDEKTLYYTISAPAFMALVNVVHSWGESNPSLVPQKDKTVLTTEDYYKTRDKNGQLLPAKALKPLIRTQKLTRGHLASPQQEFNRLYDEMVTKDPKKDPGKFKKQVQALYSTFSNFLRSYPHAEKPGWGVRWCKEHFYPALWELLTMPGFITAQSAAQFGFGPENPAHIQRMTFDPPNAECLEKLKADLIALNPNTPPEKLSVYKEERVQTLTDLFFQLRQRRPPFIFEDTWENIRALASEEPKTVTTPKKKKKTPEPQESESESDSPRTVPLPNVSSSKRKHSSGKKEKKAKKKAKVAPPPPESSSDEEVEEFVGNPPTPMADIPAQPLEQSEASSDGSSSDDDQEEPQTHPMINPSLISQLSPSKPKVDPKCRIVPRNPEERARLENRLAEQAKIAEQTKVSGKKATNRLDRS